jgi:hypothetical protein
MNVVSVWVDINRSISIYAIPMPITVSDLVVALTAAGW